MGTPTALRKTRAVLTGTSFADNTTGAITAQMIRQYVESDMGGYACINHSSADGTPAVAALNGVVELARLEDGEIKTRQFTVSDFILGPGQTVLQAGEIITSISLDALAGYGGSFQKVGQRRSLVISVACCAALVKADITGRYFDDVRLALGGVGPRPIRLNAVESLLRGEKISRRTIHDVAQLAADEVASRSRQEYRRSVVIGFVKAGIEEALENQSDVDVKFEDMENA